MSIRSPWRVVVTTLVAIAVLFVPSSSFAQQQWRATGSASAARVLPVVVGLADGRILITSGVELTTASILTTSEIHDPATGVTVSAPALPFEGYGVASIRLADGRVLIAGGTNFTGGALADFAVFDPSTSTWTTTGVMPHKAVLPAIAALPDGRILVAGGIIEETIDVYDENGDFQYSYVDQQPVAADIFNPVSNDWTSASRMIERRAIAAGVIMADGRVMVAGGQGSSSAEIYNHVTDSWTLTGPKGFTDSGISQAVRLTDGRIAHVNPISAVDLYDPIADTWTLSSTPPIIRVYTGAIAMDDGRVMLAGGLTFDVDTGQPVAPDVATTMIYDPATNSWADGPVMNATHALLRPTPLPNGRFGIFGFYQTPSAVIEVTGPNTAPVANAGADFSASTCSSCLGGVVVNGDGSTDVDNDDLTYIWSVNSTVVLTSTQPGGVIFLPPGATTVTLTVRDEFGEEDSDAVIVTVVNVEDGYNLIIANLQAQVEALTAQQAILEAQLAACQANQGGGNVTPLMNGFEQYFRTLFKDPAFELPGNTSVEELDRLLKAIKKLDKDDQREIYRALGGRKKHNGHKGRWSPHWDDDCDYDEDDDKGGKNK